MIALIKACVRRDMQVARSYSLASVVGFVVVAVGVGAALFGARTTLQSRFIGQTTLAATVATLVVIASVQQAVNALGLKVEKETQTGTLEQLAMYRGGLLPVFLAGVVGSFADQMLQPAAILAGAALSGVEIHVSAAPMILIILFAIVGTLGVGLVLAGAALVLKRTGRLGGLLGLLLVGAAATPLSELPVVGVIPIALAGHLMRRVVASGDGLADIAPLLAVLAVQGLAFFSAGVVAFRKFENAARASGSLGHY